MMMNLPIFTALSALAFGVGAQQQQCPIGGDASILASEGISVGTEQIVGGSE